MTVRQARDLAEKYAARVAMGADIQAVKQQERRDHQLATSRTLGGFITHHYGPWVQAERKTGTETIERLRSCFRDWFDYPLHDITPLIVEKWRSDELKRGKTSSTVNRDLTTLRALLSKAVDWEFLETHPLIKVKPLKTDKRATVRYLSEEETNRLRQALRRRDSALKAARVRGNAWRHTRGYPERPASENDAYADHVTPMVLLTLNTGLRRGELFQLRWADLDFASHILTVHGQNTKSHLTRHIPLNREARDVLRIWRAQTTSAGLLFPGKHGQPLNKAKKAWRNLIQNAEIAHFRWHDMRHDFASKLVMAGIPLNTVRDLLGHADLGTTLRYTHLAPDHKAQAVEALSPTYPTTQLMQTHRCKHKFMGTFEQRDVE